MRSAECSCSSPTRLLRVPTLSQVISPAVCAAVLSGASAARLRRDSPASSLQIVVYGVLRASSAPLESKMSNAS